jgi:hypothetical protein
LRVEYFGKRHYDLFYSFIYQFIAMTPGTVLAY